MNVSRQNFVQHHQFQFYEVYPEKKADVVLSGFENISNIRVEGIVKIPISVSVKNSEMNCF